MDLIERLRDFICEELPWYGSREELTSDLPLLTQGVLDSLGIFQVVGFLESEYDLELADDDLVPENFATLGAIARLVQTRSS